MNTRSVQLIDQSGTVLATAQVTDEGASTGDVSFRLPGVPSQRARLV
jgi:hypothetical protein